MSPSLLCDSTSTELSCLCSYAPFSALMEGTTLSWFPTKCKGNEGSSGKFSSFSFFKLLYAVNEDEKQLANELTSD